MQCPICGYAVADGSPQCPYCRTPIRTAPSDGSTRTTLTGEVVNTPSRPPSVYTPPVAPQPAPQPVNRPPYRSEYPSAPSSSSSPVSGLAVALAILIPLLILCALGGWGYTRYLHVSRVYPLTSQERLLQVGDTWNYKMTASVTMQNLPISKRIDGTAKFTVVQGTFDGKPVLAMSEIGETMHSIAKMKAGLTYFVQDPNTRNVTHLGDTGGPAGTVRHIVQHNESGAGPWNGQKVYSSSTLFDTGEWVQETKRVIGTETVATPVGKLKTWVCQTTVSFGGGQNSSSMDGNVSIDGTEWYAPQIGWPVKIDGTVRSSLLQMLSVDANVTMTLDSTNVPPEPPRPITESPVVQPPASPLQLRPDSKDRLH